VRVFLCDFTGFSVAIPMHSVSSLGLYVDDENDENQDTCVSLPRLFKLPKEKIRHSIVMKNNLDDNNIAKSNITLFTTEVECETDIPNEEIYPLPKIFGRMRFSTFFSGIKLGPHPHLVLNSERLVQSILKKDLQYD